MEQAGNVLKETRPEPARLLKVLLDARKLGDGGIGTYISNLLRGLVATGRVDLTVLSDPERVREACLPDDIAVLADAAKRYSLDELLFMPKRIPFNDFDLFHVPHYTLPFSVPIPTVVTVHDLIHVYHPQHFYYPWIAKPYIRSALRRASRVLTVSRASRDQIREFSKQDHEICAKLRVVPNAVEDEFLRIPAHSVAERKGDFLLAVLSNPKPHKGLQDLLAAFLQLAEESEAPGGMRLDKRLVLVGRGTEHIKGREFRAPGSGEVIALGEVSREALRRLFSNAAALIVPTLAEGFCLPVIEAHAAGIPVIARPVPAVLELITAHDVVCSGFSVEALRDGIRAFLRRGRGCRGLEDALREHATRFSAEVTAHAVCDVYEEVVTTGRKCVTSQENSFVEAAV